MPNYTRTGLKLSGSSGYGAMNPNLKEEVWREVEQPVSTAFSETRGRLCHDLGHFSAGGVGDLLEI